MLPPTLVALHCNSVMSTLLQVKIFRDGKEFGTFEAKDIIHLTGGDNYLVYHLKPHTDLYMHEGMTEWAPLIDLVRKLSAPLSYRIAQAGKEVGTYDFDEVFRLLAVGTLKPTDLYKTEGMTSWNLLSNLEIQRRYGLDLK